MAFRSVVPEASSLPSSGLPSRTTSATKAQRSHPSQTAAARRCLQCFMSALARSLSFGAAVAFGAALALAFAFGSGVGVRSGPSRGRAARAAPPKEERAANKAYWRLCMGPHADRLRRIAAAASVELGGNTTIIDEAQSREVLLSTIISLLPLAAP